LVISRNYTNFNPANSNDFAWFPSGAGGGGSSAVQIIGDATETVKGVLPLATPAETTAGTDNTKAVHSLGLKSAIVLKTTIAQIRTLLGALPNTNFYTTDLGQEGSWYYDSSDVTSADNTGTILVTSDGKRIKRIIQDKINMSWFGVVGDGTTDDSSNVLKALRASELLKKILFVKKGTYNIASWTDQEFSYVNIQGENKYNCVFVGALLNSSRVKFLSLGTSSELTTRGISIQGFDRCYYSEKHVTSVIISDCYFKNNRYATYFANSITVYPNSIIDYISVSDNVIDTSSGFEMRCGVLNGATFTNNKFTNVTRNATYYPMITGQGVPLFAIAVGDGDDVSTSLGQNLNNRIVITGNTINTMHNPTYQEIGGFFTTNALAAYGRKVIISNNVVSNLTTNGVTDCEAIYTKAVEAIISNNILTNCGTIDNASGVIAIKGVSDLDINGNPINKPKSKYIKVYGNIISNDPVNFPSYCGIFTFGGQNIEIYDNRITNQGQIGQSGSGIAIQGSSSLSGVLEINIHDNIISDIYGEHAIVSTPNFVKKLDINNNIISNIFGKNSSTQTTIIRVRSTSTVIENLNIKGNKFYQDILDPVNILSIKFIETQPTTTSNYLNIEDNVINVTTNNFSTASLVLGVSILKGSGDVSNLKISNNHFLGDVGSSKFRPYVFNGTITPFAQSWLPNLVFNNSTLNGSTIDYLYKTAPVTDSDYTLSRAEDFIDLPIITANRVLTLPTANISNKEIQIRNKNNSGFTWSFPADSKVRDGRNTGVTTIPNSSITTVFFDGINWAIKAISSDYGTPALTSNAILTTGNQSKSGLLTLNPSISAVASIARGFYVNPSLTATANNDVLVANDINSSFGIGSFTGVTQAALRVNNSIIPSLDNAILLGSSSLNWFSVRARQLVSTTGALNVSTNGSFDLSLGVSATNAINIFNSSRNVLIQNGGVFTDAGYRLDVQGTTRLSSTTTLGTAPTTSAGSYDILTRNSSSGEVEKIISSNGAYSPTATLGSNVSGVTIFNHTYTRIGNIVTVFGLSTSTLTVASVTSNYTITLPVARATGTGISIGYGQTDGARSTETVPLRVSSLSTTTATISFTSTLTGSLSNNYSFQYDVTQ
jgi:hypothetical protein